MIRVSQGTKEDMSKKGEKRFNGKTMLGITILNMVTHNYPSAHGRQKQKDLKLESSLDFTAKLSQNSTIWGCRSVVNGKPTMC